jgi:hypothetical protein
VRKGDGLAIGTPGQQVPRLLLVQLSALVPLVPAPVRLGKIKILAQKGYEIIREYRPREEGEGFEN